MNTHLRWIPDEAIARVRGIAALITASATLALSAPVSAGSEASSSNDGPTVTVEAPRMDESPLSGPVAIALAWTAHDDADIDLNSFRVWYKLGFASKNVTERLLSAVRSAEGSRFDATGLFVPRADLPPGHHRLVIELADSRNRRSYTELEFQIAKR
jgi:hypothetical protein